METPDNFRPKLQARKKKNTLKGAWLFVVVTCLAIIAACLVPLILGKSPLDLILETETEKPQISSIETDSNQNDEKSAESYENNIKTPSENKKEIDPLELVTVEERSLKVDPYHGDAQNAKQDEGDLPEVLPLGLEASTPENTTRTRITLRGDTLEQIENKSKQDLSPDNKAAD